MGIVSPGFSGRGRSSDERLPPGQYLVTDFPVLSAGPTPRVDTGKWELRHHHRDRAGHRWNWPEFQALPAEEPTVDIHCVTKWSKLGTPGGASRWTRCWTTWRPAPGSRLAHSYGGYTTNLPLEDLLDGKAWIAFDFDGEPLAAGARRPGPAARSAPLLLEVREVGQRASTCPTMTTPGFWESLGYHNYGDPWREQRYWGD